VDHLRGEALRHPHQDLERGVASGERGLAVRAGDLVLPGDHRTREVGLRREVEVERALRQARALGDGVHRGAHVPPLVELTRCRVDDRGSRGDCPLLPRATVLRHDPAIVPRGTPG
jgi:hypothetical protein